MLNVIFIVGVIALRHLPTLLNVDVDYYCCFLIFLFYSVMRFKKNSLPDS